MSEAVPARTIGVITVARSDYGIYVPVLARIQRDPDLRLHLIAGGMHLSPEFGLTVRAIEEDGFPIGDRVEMLLSSDSPEGIAKSIGVGTIGFAQAYARFRPDVLLVLGDRFEMFAAVVAAVPFVMPIAHIHGGESTEGAIDDALRHSITKMSHLHFVATDTYARRVAQMGEEPWRITVSGSPGLDTLNRIDFLSPDDLKRTRGIDVGTPFLLVTFHPVTLKHQDAERHTRELLAALEAVDAGIVLTSSNADTNSRVVSDLMRAFAASQTRTCFVDNLGTRGYFSLMKDAAAMVGNSSSGIVEAASFQLPVVNVGDRQRGRLRARNVIDVGESRQEILAGIQEALRPSFRAGLADLVNPYGDGRAAERIVERLKRVELNDRLLQKRFYEVGT